MTSLRNIAIHWYRKAFGAPAGSDITDEGLDTVLDGNSAVALSEAAISSPLLESSIEGARGILLNITGGSSLGILEVNEAAEIIQGVAHPDANIIFGTVIDENMGDAVRVTVIAAGFDRWTDAAPAMPEARPAPQPERDTETVFDDDADVFDELADPFEETAVGGDDFDDLDVPSFLK